MRVQFGYKTPDDWYEAFLFECVDSETKWLDVGCGRFLFPSNRRGARVLASRCKLLMGLDPSDNIDENPYVHERAKCQIDELVTERKFDLITLRMVAEHIQKPDEAVRALSRLLTPQGRIVIYTIYRWSPVSLISAATPMSVHHAVKGWLWRTEEKDTFPIAYKMNTRRALKRLFADVGLREEYFAYLDDCRSLQRWKMTNFLELSVWKALNAVGAHYPEVCILASFRNAN